MFKITHIGTLSPREILFEKGEEGKVVRIFLTSQGEIQGAIWRGNRAKQVTILGLPQNKLDSNCSISTLKQLFARCYSVQCVSNDEIRISGKLRGGGDFDALYEDCEGGLDELIDFLEVFLGVAGLALTTGPMFPITAAGLGVAALVKFKNKFEYLQLQKKVQEIESSNKSATEKLENLKSCFSEASLLLLKEEKEITSVISEKIKEEKANGNIESIIKLITFSAFIMSFKDPQKSRKLGSIGVNLGEIMKHAGTLKNLVSRSAPLLECVVPGISLLLSAGQTLMSYMGSQESEPLDELAKTIVQLQAQTVREIRLGNEKLFQEVEARLGSHYAGILDRIDKLEQNVNRISKEANDQFYEIQKNQERILKRIDEKFMEKEKIEFLKAKKKALYCANMNPSQEQATRWVGDLMTWAGLSKDEVFTGRMDYDFSEFAQITEGAQNWETLFFGINWLNQYLRKHHKALELHSNSGYVNPIIWADSVRVLISFRLKTLKYKECFLDWQHTRDLRKIMLLGSNFREFTEKLQCSKEFFSSLTGRYLQAVQNLEEALKRSLTDPGVKPALQNIEEPYILLQAFTLIAFPRSRSSDPFFMELLQRGGDQEMRLLSGKDWEKVVSGLRPEKIEPAIEKSRKAIQVLDSAIKQKISLLKSGGYQDHLPIISVTLFQLQQFWSRVYPDESPLTGVGYTPKPLPKVDVAEVCKEDIFLSAEYGSTARVLQLLEEGSPIDGRDPRSGKTLLHIAAQKGNIDLVKELLRRGAQVILRDNNGNTPLDITSSNTIADLLMQKMSPFDQLGKTKKLALKWTSRFKNTSNWPEVRISGQSVIDLASNPHKVHAYDVSNGELLFSVQRKAIIHYKVTSYNNSHFIYESMNHTVTRYTVEKGQTKITQLPFQYQDAIDEIHPTCNYFIGQKCFVVNKKWTMEKICFDLAKNEVVLACPWSNALNFLGVDKLVMASPANIVIFDLATKKELYKFSIPKSWQKSTLSENKVALLYGDKILAYSLENGKEIFSSKYSNAYYNPYHQLLLSSSSLPFILKENLLIAPCSLTNKEFLYDVWDLASSKSIHTFNSTEASINFSVQGNRVLFFPKGKDRGIEVFDFEKKKLVATLAKDQNTSSAFLRGNTLIAAEKDQLTFRSVESDIVFYALPFQSKNWSVGDNCIASIDLATNSVQLHEIVDSQQ